MALATPGFGDELAKMEGAARVMLSQEVDQTQRREAESYFMSLRDANLSPELCRQIIENTGEPYVIFQLAQCLTVQLLRNWNSCTSDELKTICKYLLEFPLSHPNLPSFAIAELFKSAAVIYKRGANWNAEMILEPVSRLLQSTDDAMQTMGLRMIEAISMEFSTMWRAIVAISFQTHHAAKKHFEENLLKKFMQLSLACLSRFVNDVDVNEHIQVCDRFLKVAVLVLQWNFTTTMITAFLKVNLYSMNTSVALRPPPSWSDLFQDEKLLPFFFELHKRVRGNQQLAQNSLQCIMQLAAVMGTVLDRREKSGADVRASTTPQPHDLYVQRFISALIDCFADCHPHELLPFTTAMHRIFSHHPMPIFKRFPSDLITNFVKFVVHWARTLAAPAMHQDKENDEYGLVDALTNVFTCWTILLRSTTFAPDVQSLIAEQNNLVIESFLKAVLAPPYGERPANQIEAHEQTEDDELDDHRHYAIILTDIGVFCRSSIEAFTQFVIKSFNERINQRSIIAQSGAVSAAERYLWFEDMHWMLLMISSFLQDSDRDIALRLDRGYKAKEWTLIDTPAFFSQCITQLDSFQAPNNADPLTIICGMVAHWTGILLNAIESQGPASSFVSPEICRSTVRTFAATIQFLTSMTDESAAALFDVQTPSDLGPLPTLPTSGEFSAGLVDLIIRLCFAVFRAYPGEKQLCKTAVCFLLQESEKRAQYIAKSPILYEQLASISLEKLPSRADFMTCLVNVGSNLSSSQERSQMNDLILQPLANRFLAQVEVFQNGNTNLASDLVDLLECFSGIAKAAQIESGNILYAYLLPILHASVRIMTIAGDHQPLVQGILEMFKNVATTLFIFVDVKTDSDDGNNFFNLLYQLFENYKLSQAKRFRTTAALSEVEEEEQIADLVSLLQIIGCSISKPFIIYTTPANVSDVSTLPLCHKTLEMIIPLLNEDALRLPSLSNAFFRLLLHISESSPTVFISLDQTLFEQLLQCLCWAISGAAGLEPTRLALETITGIARMLAMTTDTIEGPLTYSFFTILGAKVFEIALHATTTLESELHLQAVRAFHTVICLNRRLFFEYVESLLAKPENAANRQLLLDAFNELLPENETNTITRQAFKVFSGRFDKFTNQFEQIIVV
ncbi:ATP synthase subunit gamma, mitochondrial [Aphelenchoides besseyi]|nr:ATP synthase subunit gamma, mitochondrial [Aphelenchoides besseyi]